MDRSIPFRRGAGEELEHALLPTRTVAEAERTWAVLRIDFAAKSGEPCDGWDFAQHEKYDRESDPGGWEKKAAIPPQPRMARPR
jgi:hypothetical protein